MKDNKWLFPPYPGLGKDTKFSFEIKLSEIWQENILEREIERTVEEIANPNERIGTAVNLYIEKIENILLEDTKPHVILCTIPEKIEKHCGISEHTRGAKTPKATALQKKLEGLKKSNQTFLDQWGLTIKVEKKKEKPIGFDLRNALKGKVMGINRAVPIQILKESAMDAILNYKVGGTNPRQDPASFAWNFSTGLYYKAEGYPWRLAKLRPETCYVGISFFKDKINPSKDFETSMAQVFTDTGEGLVLRGKEVYVDEKTSEAHLEEEQAKEFLEDCIKKYTQKTKRNPVRVVIHKKTSFSKGEKKGFSDIIDKAKRDFVTIKNSQGIRFMRNGSYPVLRGTLIHLSKNDYLLYTSGFIPRLRTYSGHRIPNPLHIHHEGDSQIQEICNEILGLTKLNWNTADFSTSIPITLKFSEKVGRVLSELEKGSPIKDHYRWYM